MLSAFQKFIEGVAEEGETLFKRVKDKALFRKIVSAAFLIARADGNFDASEKSALGNYISKKLDQYGISDILEILSICEEKVAFDVSMGVQEILDDVCTATGDDAKMIIRIACYIGAADGDFDDDEKAVARDMAKRMGLNPTDYGL